MMLRRAMTGSASRFATGLLVGALALGLAASPAFAQTADELKAARELFQEAFKAEQEKRFADALEKFQRVAKVRESASVRYRIATVLVGLGRLREARDMYRALGASRSTLPPGDQDTADSAAEKATELDKRIPRLTVHLPENAPADTQVTVDSTNVPVATPPRPIEVDPGEHVIAVTGRGMRRSEQTVTLTDGGGEVSHTVALTPDSPTAQTAGGKGDILPWVAIGGGAALALVGGVMLVSRESAISDIEAACPAGKCPTNRRSDIEGERDRAELFGPLGGTLGVLGLAAVGVGVYLLVRPTSTPSKAAYSIAPGPGGLRLALPF